MTNLNKIIEVKNLSKTVPTADGELAILTDINFDIAAGQSVAIVGASGSGKSTLLGLLAGLDRASSGVIGLAAQNLQRLSEDELAALRAQVIGFVFQSFQLLGHLTALENVMLPLELTGDEQAREKARAMLERVGLGQRLNHYPKVLSGGEQQRVALARAFVTTPQVLLADEPTGNLDSKTGAEIIELMFALNREHHTTLVLVTHDSAIAARCERQLTIAAGRLL